MTVQRWSNVEGYYYAEVKKENGSWYFPRRVWDTTSRSYKEVPTPLPAVVQDALNTSYKDEEDWITIEFDALVSGSSDSGNINGLPENCWPPDFEQEVCVEQVYIGDNNLTGDVKKALENFFSEELDEDIQLPDPDDYDPREDWED